MSTLSDRLNDLTGSIQSIAERVQVLESSICSCRDCVMHREKARRASEADKGASMTHVPSEEPAARRKHPGLDSCHLHRRTLLESDIPNHWFCPACHPGLVAPAAPVQDVREKVAAELRKACLEQFGSTWSNDVSGQFADVAISTIGLAGAPQTVTRGAIESLWAAMGLCRRGAAVEIFQAAFPGLKVEA